MPIFWSMYSLIGLGSLIPLVRFMWADWCRDTGRISKQSVGQVQAGVVLSVVFGAIGAALWPLSLVVVLMHYGAKALKAWDAAREELENEGVQS